MVLASKIQYQSGTVAIDWKIIKTLLKMKKQSLTTALQITSVQFLFMLNDYTTFGWFMWLWWWNQVGFKNKYKKLSAGWAQEGREVTSFESTVVSRRARGTWAMPHMSVSLTPSVHLPNLPHQTPAPVIDDTVEKTFFSVTESTFTNYRGRAIYHTLRPASHTARDISHHYMWYLC